MELPKLKRKRGMIHFISFQNEQGEKIQSFTKITHRVTPWYARNIICWHAMSATSLGYLEPLLHMPLSMWHWYCIDICDAKVHGGRRHPRHTCTNMYTHSLRLYCLQHGVAYSMNNLVKYKMPFYLEIIEKRGLQIHRPGISTMKWDHNDSCWSRFFISDYHDNVVSNKATKRQ